jgi:hypothetical protein
MLHLQVEPSSGLELFLLLPDDNLFLRTIRTASLNI